MDLFHIEGKYVQYGAKLADLLWLNVLTLVCCLPVFTIGASLSAMHYVLLQIIRDAESRISASFFRSFRVNFRQATAIWGGLLGVGAFLAYDIYLVRQQKLGLPQALLFGLAVIGLIWACVFVWVFPLQSHYENTVANTVKNALRLAIAHPVRTLIMLLAVIAPVVLALIWDSTLIFLLILGLTGPGVICASQYNRVFLAFDKDQT